MLLVIISRFCYLGGNAHLFLAIMFCKHKINDANWFCLVKNNVQLKACYLLKNKQEYRLVLLMTNWIVLKNII